MSGHYFDTTPGGPSRPRQRTVELGWGPVEVTTDDGVFSGNGVDPGTAVLLDRLPAPAPGEVVLDLGCGWGPLALAVAHREPAALVWAVDVNERAVELCRRNAESLGLHVRAVTPDALPDDVTVDLVVSNPPVRIGKAALHLLLDEHLARMGPSGRAVLVVQRNLGADSLARWLTETGRPTRRLASRKGYRLLECRND